MFSAVSPGFLYTDVSPDISEHDIDVISDLWTFDNREVYRGSRDAKYTHANVYWLYNESLERGGCVEHKTTDHTEFETLWFHESPFGTLLQEEGWKESDSLWAILPQRSVELYLAEGWTTPEFVLERCLGGATRVISPSMLIRMPEVFGCNECKKRTLQSNHGTAQALDFPSKEKILFVDDDMIVYVPPPTSLVWSQLSMQLPQPDAGSSQEPVQELVQTHREPTPPLSPQPSPPPVSPAQEPTQ